MRSRGEWTVRVVVFALLICGMGWWKQYKFHDCRRVGHTRLYCWLDLGE